MFTDELRKELWTRGFWGRRVTFRFRMESGKSKKVSGRLVYVSHEPERGFRIHLKHVRWLGRYWGSLELLFPTRQIIWTRVAVPQMLQSGEQSRLLPLMEAGTKKGLVR